MALVLFDDFLHLRVDDLPDNDLDIALYFHKTRRDYGRSWKFYQTLEYYKKTLHKKDTFTNVDVGGTGMFFDPGSTVVQMY